MEGLPLPISHTNSTRASGPHTWHTWLPFSHPYPIPIQRSPPCDYRYNSPTQGCIVEAAEALRYRRHVEHAEASVSVRPLGACAKSCQIGLATRSFPTAHIPNLLARAERYTGPNRVAHGAKSLDGLDSGTIISPECLRSLRSYRYDCSIRRNSNIFSNMVML